jgi:hypothetical protein
MYSSTTGWDSGLSSINCTHKELAVYKLYNCVSSYYCSNFVIVTQWTPEVQTSVPSPSSTSLFLDTSNMRKHQQDQSLYQVLFSSNGKWWLKQKHHKYEKRGLCRRVKVWFGRTCNSSTEKHVLHHLKGSAPTMSNTDEAGSKQLKYVKKNYRYVVEKNYTPMSSIRNLLTTCITCWIHITIF